MSKIDASAWLKNLPSSERALVMASLRKALAIARRKGLVNAREVASTIIAEAEKTRKTAHKQPIRGSLPPRIACV